MGHGQQCVGVPEGLSYKAQGEVWEGGVGEGRVDREERSKLQKEGQESVGVLCMEVRSGEPFVPACSS